MPTEVLRVNLILDASMTLKCQICVLIRLTVAFHIEGLGVLLDPLELLSSCEQIVCNSLSYFFLFQRCQRNI